MSETALLLFAGAVFGLMVLVSGVLLYRMVSCLKDISNHAFRAADRDRADFMQMIEKLLERKDTPPQMHFDVSRLHSMERREALKTLAEENKRPAPVPDLVTVSSEDAEVQAAFT